MRIAIYHGSVPNQKHFEKVMCLQHFSTGVKHCGDLAVDVQGHMAVQADVGVIQGWTTGGRDRPHLNLRTTIIQRTHNYHAVMADSNLFLYANRDNPLHYLRYSFNGIFPNTGNYCDTIILPKRWDTISRAFDIQLKDWRHTGEHILLLLQRNGGWSMNELGVTQWAKNVISQLRFFTDRPIVIRPHPGDKAAPTYLHELHLPGVRISDPKQDLRVDLNNCWAAVNHNSSPAVGALIEGVPVFVTDPEKSQCRDAANTDLSKIEAPDLIDRQHWVERIAMSHWSFDELRSGEAWAHMREFVR